METNFSKKADECVNWLLQQINLQYDRFKNIIGEILARYDDAQIAEILSALSNIPGPVWGNYIDRLTAEANPTIKLEYLNRLPEFKQPAHIATILLKSSLSINQLVIFLNKKPGEENEEGTLIEEQTPGSEFFASLTPAVNTELINFIKSITPAQVAMMAVTNDPNYRLLKPLFGVGAREMRNSVVLDLYSNVIFNIFGRMDRGSSENRIHNTSITFSGLYRGELLSREIEFKVTWISDTSMHISKRKFLLTLIYNPRESTNEVGSDIPFSAEFDGSVAHAWATSGFTAENQDNIFQHWNNFCFRLHGAIKYCVSDFLKECEERGLDMNKVEFYFRVDKNIPNTVERNRLTEWVIRSDPVFTSRPGILSVKKYREIETAIKFKFKRGSLLTEGQDKISIYIFEQPSIAYINDNFLHYPKMNPTTSLLNPPDPSGSSFF